MLNCIPKGIPSLTNAGEQSGSSNAAYSKAICTAIVAVLKVPLLLPLLMLFTSKLTECTELHCRKRNPAAEDGSASQSASDASSGDGSSEEDVGSEDEVDDTELKAIQRAHKRNAVPERKQPGRNARTVKANLKEESHSPGPSFLSRSHTSLFKLATVLEVLNDERWMARALYCVL